MSSKLRFKISHRGRVSKKQTAVQEERRGDKDRKPAPRKKRK